MSKADRVRIEELNAEAERAEDLIGRQADILRAVANALHGGECPDGYWSHHDLAQLAAQKMVEIEALKAEVALLKEAQPK